jgi:hypothetical protein
MSANVWTLIFTVIVAIPGIISCVVLIGQSKSQNRKNNSEANENDAGTLKTVWETSNQAITQSSQVMRENIKLTRENALLTDRVATLEKRANAWDLEKTDYALLVEDLQDWVKRLSQQVIDLGGKPVEMRKREVL